MNIYENRLENHIDIDESKFSEILNPIKNSKFFNDFKKTVVKIKNKLKEVIVVNLLKLYYIAIDENVPLADKLTAAMCVLKVVYPNASINYGNVDDEYETATDKIKYAVEFLGKYINDDIAEKAENTYNEWVK